MRVNPPLCGYVGNTGAVSSLVLEIQFILPGDEYNLAHPLKGFLLGQPPPPELLLPLPDHLLPILSPLTPTAVEPPAYCAQWPPRCRDVWWAGTAGSGFSQAGNVSAAGTLMFLVKVQVQYLCTDRALYSRLCPWPPLFKTDSSMAPHSSLTL